MDQEKNLDVLQGSPITIVLGGAELSVKKLTIENQMIAIKEIQRMASDSVEDKKDSLDFTFDLMIRILSIATDLTGDAIRASSDLIEIAAAFQAVWKQNRLSFLLQTITQMTKELSPN